MIGGNDTILIKLPAREVFAVARLLEACIVFTLFHN